MPELPDLVHIVHVLGPALAGRTVASCEVKEPIVLRVLVPGDFADLVRGRRFESLERHGPFLHFRLGPNQIESEAQVQKLDREAIQRNELESEGLEFIMHLMLAGRLRLAPAGTKPLAYTAFTLGLDDGQVLSYGDEKSMGKVYLCREDQLAAIPLFLTQGIDVTSPEFTYELFESLVAKKRCQARVFLMDQSLLSAIGNAYADEILFEAGIHPKTSCHALSPGKRRELYVATRKVLAWGVEEVEASGKPLEEKARGHMKVRGRAGEPCPRCGATIRKAGVLGFDAFFCPVCQPDIQGKGLDWTRLPKEAR